MMRQIGQDVIKMYEKYVDKKTTWKTTKLDDYVLELPAQYELIKILGKGSYGVVAAAKDHSGESQFVAIKKMTNVFEHKTFARRTLRELRLLRLLKHENIVSIKTIILPKSRAGFNDLYVVFELMDADLTTILKGQQVLSPKHHKFIMYQILRALKFIHTSKIVHRDLKPRNLLIDANCDLKICDFGLSRPTIKEIKANVLTDYVTTRWYRAPQLLLGETQYTEAVDMWSVGCIFAEMILKRPILTAGSTREQLKLILECLGMPNLELMPNLTIQSKHCLRKMCQNIKHNNLFDAMMSKIPPEEKEVLRKFLVFEPSKRITVKEALKLPYFEELHLEEDQPEGTPVSYLQFEFQDYNFTTQQLKDLLYEEILLYHYPTFTKQYEYKKQKKQSLISHIIKNSNADFIDPEADDDGED